jgi:hypothetical protein
MLGDMRSLSKRKRVNMQIFALCLEIHLLEAGVESIELPPASGTSGSSTQKITMILTALTHLRTMSLSQKRGRGRSRRWKSMRVPAMTYLKVPRNRLDLHLPLVVPLDLPVQWGRHPL